VLTIRSSIPGSGWSIRDANGRVVFANQLPFTGDIQLPLETLPAGSYFIQLEYNTTTLSRRFVKF
jgi:hypothetical protein